MDTQIETLKKEFVEALAKANSLQQVEELKVKYLGKKGPIQDLMKGLRDCTPEERPLAGKKINDVKEYIDAILQAKYEHCLQGEEAANIAKETLDISLPGRCQHAGNPHIITKVMDEMLDIYAGMGFSVQYGPDIDTDYYNFEALNFAKDHPARDMQDTFYINPNVLLRTHTSNIQARMMETHKPPIRIAAPGRAYRNETITARSHVFFHQIEIFYVDTDVTFADLQFTLTDFLSKLFHTQVETRFRPSYFPFVEPGMEVDLRCLTCGGSGCPLCKHTGWLEIAGAGMIHPEVLKNGDIDSEHFSGFAWGMGVERIVMLKHGITDIRSFTENDLRFLHQFR